MEHEFTDWRTGGDGHKRHRGLKADQQRTFLLALRECGIMAESARACKLPMTKVAQSRREDDDFAVAVEDALEVHAQAKCERLEQALVDRGIGYEEDILYKGEATGHKTRRYSDKAAIAVLGKHDPGYRPAKEGGGGPQVAIQVIINADGKGGDIPAISAASTGAVVIDQGVGHPQEELSS